MSRIKIVWGEKHKYFGIEKRGSGINNQESVKL